MRFVATFLFGAVAAYCLILFGWIGLADVLDFGDMDGGKIMTIAFVAAPLGALVAGIVLAVATRRRAIPGATRG